MKNLIIKIIGLTIDAISAGLRARQERKKREAEEKFAAEIKRIEDQQEAQAAQRRAQKHAEHAALIRGAALKEMEHRP